MGISTLEEKFQSILLNAGTEVFHFLLLADRTTQIQREMRHILNALTPHVCSCCDAKCCEGFPLEGWFSLEDYLLFRVKYGTPIPPPHRIRRDTACSFLTLKGCSLPEDLRPFTCVKINCEKLSERIHAIGKVQEFNRLKISLEKIQREVSSLITTRNLLSSDNSQSLLKETVTL